MLQSPLIKGNSCQLKKHIFEIIHVPHHRLPVETFVRITQIEIQAINSFYLKMNEFIKNFPVDFLSFTVKF